MELRLRKTMGGWVPASEDDTEKMARLKLGAVIHADFKEERNSKFHDRFFALLRYAFDHWDVEEHEGPNGRMVQKNFDRFREDLIILAGYYELTINLRGESRAQAHSISFGRMDQAKFEEVYSAVVNVILQRVLKNYTRSDLDRVIDEVLRFT